MPDHPASYAALSSTRKTHPLLIHALRRARLRPGRALDIGAGALGETRYLLSQGFAVDAVDRDPMAWQLADHVEPGAGRFTMFPTDIRTFPIPLDTYDLVVALHVLPFLPAPDLSRVASRIVASLRPGGVLCCTMFGIRDSWVHAAHPVTPVTEARLAALFPGLRPHYHAEREFDGSDAEGTPKHWHVLQQILVRTEI